MPARQRAVARAQWPPHASFPSASGSSTWSSACCMAVASRSRVCADGCGDPHASCSVQRAAPAAVNDTRPPHSHGTTRASSHVSSAQRTQPHSNDLRPERSLRRRERGMSSSGPTRYEKQSDSPAAIGRSARYTSRWRPWLW
eukprot:2292008-Prymnesium_polylepis.1